MRAVFFVLAFMLSLATAQAAWPDHPLRIIVPISPGGSNDLVARLVGAEMSTALGQPVIVENRPGASGLIGMRAAAQAAPDGYTLVLANSGALAITPAMQTHPAYDPERDFEPVGMVMDMPIMLVVRKDLPCKSVTELISLMRSRPDAIAFGSPGAGQTPHMAAEFLRRVAGTRTTIAAYRGAGPAAKDLVAGVTQALFDTSATLPMIKNGTLRVLAITGRRRSPLLPNVPTLAESGVAGMEMSSWFALLAPAKTPKEIVDRLNKLLRTILAKPEIVARLRSIHAEPIPSSVAQTRSYIASEVRYWHKTVKLLDSSKQ